MTRPSQKQFELAKVLGVDINKDTRDVAAARLMDEVADAVGEKSSEPSTNGQQCFSSSLGIDVVGVSKRIASAVIHNELDRLNKERLAELQIEAGDQVIRTDRFERGGTIYEVEKEFTVSSISSSGRIYFKGGRGEGAWPTQVRKVQAC